MDALPPQKFQQRQWRFGRKRRRSGTEPTESEADSKLVKKDGDEAMDTNVDANNAAESKADVTVNTAIKAEIGNKIE